MAKEIVAENTTQPTVPSVKEQAKPQIIEKALSPEKIKEVQAGTVIDEKCLSLQQLRKAPLLVLYYPDKQDAQIRNFDMATIYNEFRSRGFNRDTKKIDHLDVLFHTLGGNPDAGYMLAQIIRSFSHNVNFLIPYHAASAGTLASFSGNKILLGAFAYLSPIDVSLGEIPLMSIEYFINFAVDCRKKLETAFQEDGVKGAKSTVESDLLVEMIKQVGSVNVGKFYRERTLTGYYAHRLLMDYMFAHRADKETIVSNLIRELLFNYPAHEFYFDYQMCKALELPVEEMSEVESDMTKDIVQTLDESTSQNIICKLIEKDYRVPFVRLYNGAQDG